MLPYICINIYLAFATALLKFFGKLCLSIGCEAARLSEQFPLFLQCTLEMALMPDDHTLWGLAVDTLGLLTSYPAGRMVLFSMEQVTLQVLASLGVELTSSLSERRNRVLRLIKMMVSCEEEEDASRQESRTMQWCLLVHPTLCSLLLSFVRMPFSDLRVAVLHVMMEMARWEWGQRLMQGCPGLLEFLLDREVVLDKEGCELKYDAVRRCVESECGVAVWGNVDMLKLRKFQKEGPFYQKSETSVAIEELS